MTEKIKIFYYALWIAHPVFLTGIAAVMLRRKLHSKFMFFFAYIVTEILTFAVIFPSYMHNYTAYFYLYWTTNALNVIMGFMVIHEVFSDVFRPFHTLKDLGTVLFKWAGLVMLLVAGVVSVSNSTGDLTPWMQAIVTAQRCVRIIQCGMVLFLLFFARYLGVSRRQHSFGIALGFGGYAAVELVLIASWAGEHLGNLTMDLVNMTAYNAALLTWFGYMLATSPARNAAETLLQPHRWEQSLSDIHHPLPANSLIPMFEGMVDRALSRTPTGASSPVEVGEDAASGVSARAVPMSEVGLSRLSERIETKR